MAALTASELATAAIGARRPGKGAVISPFIPAALTRDQCFQLITEVPYGRIIYTEGALPAVSPVRFELDGEALLLAVDADTALAEASRDGVLAFQADFVDARDGLGWTVTMTGHARHADTESSPNPAGELTGGRLTVRLVPELVTGWRTYIDIPKP